MEEGRVRVDQSYADAPPSPALIETSPAETLERRSSVTFRCGDKVYRFAMRTDGKTARVTEFNQNAVADKQGTVDSINAALDRNGGSNVDAYCFGYDPALTIYGDAYPADSRFRVWVNGLGTLVIDAEISRSPRGKPRG